MIIALTGLKGCGKDTVASHLIKQYGFERRAFADPLKKSIAALFDIPFHEVDRLKNDFKARVSIYKMNNAELSDLILGRQPISKEFDFRELLQRYGTEAHREIFDRNFWVDQTLPVQVYTGRKIVVTDCRFINESERVKDLGGMIVRISRPELTTNDTHVSEQEQLLIKADYTVFNKGTFDDLYYEVDAMIDTLLDKVA